VRKKIGGILKKKTQKKDATLREKQIKPSTNGNIKKQYLKSRPACKVTFRLPKDAAINSNKVMIVGEFNNWDTEATQLKKVRNGDFSITLELDKNREYRFRYLIDNERWENDWYADKYLPNGFGSDDSIVVI
jgi:1,4-alpha-glucan branching enzyme